MRKRTCCPNSKRCVPRNIFPSATFMFVCFGQAPPHITFTYNMYNFIYNKQECGSNYTAKLEGMFQDIELSRECQSAFQAHIAKIQAAAQGGQGSGGAGAGAGGSVSININSSSSSSSAVLAGSSGVNIGTPPFLVLIFYSCFIFALRVLDIYLIQIRYLTPMQQFSMVLKL